MKSLEQAFDRVKDHLESPKFRKKSVKSKRNSIDSALPFSEEDVATLEKEMLGLDTHYNEPNFTAQKKKTAPKKKSREVVEKIIASPESPEILQKLSEIQNSLSVMEKKILINTDTKVVNANKIAEESQPLELIKMMIAEVRNKDTAKYQLQTVDGIKDISLSQYYDVSKFIACLQQYQYSLAIDRAISFEGEYFNSYIEKLLIISENLRANSFRFFEKSSVVDDVIKNGHQIKVRHTLTSQVIDTLELMFNEIKEAINSVEYQKQFLFAKLLNERSLILNAITILNEMLGEYIIHAAKELSPLASNRIQSYTDYITSKVSSRKAYYNFYRSSKKFFVSHFCLDENKTKLSFFPHNDSGNEEIKNKMQKLFSSNKMNKSKHFYAYCELIERVGILRNDLAHGNTSKVYKNIRDDLNEILVDFNYLAIEKNFLQAK